jgi:23S rRNA pseudouridine1911/1915/1917 synthase
MPKASGDLPIIHEDADILVIDKPPGLLTSTVPRERRPTALAILRDYLSQSDPRARLGLIHRLDRDASGLLVFSKHHDAFRALKKQFFDHTVDRIYSAVICGNLKPDKDRIRSRLVEHADGSVHSTKREDRGEEAITDYQVIRRAGDYSLVRVKLFTGRKHQIRAHLAERGAPIVGDRIYGPEEVNNTSRLLLAATELSLDHPRTGKRVHFKLDMPEEIRRLFR